MTSPHEDTAIANPVSLEEGPDEHVRRFLHGAFEERRQQGRVFDTASWAEWSEPEVAGCIRALAADYLAGPGRGFDWVTAAYQAEFVLASHYHNLATQAGLAPAPALTLNFYDPFGGEGIEIEVKPPSGIAIDPVPGAPPISASANSRRARALLMVAPPFDALNAVDRAFFTGIQQLGDFFQTKNRLPLILMGAALTLWRGLQASHHVRAGSIYRGIRDPRQPSWPDGEMRVVYARSGEHIGRAVAAAPDEATLLLD